VNDSLLNPDAVPGNNNPPDAIALLNAQLEQTHTDLIDRQEKLLAMEGRLPATCDDADMAAKLSDGIKALTAFVKNSEATRVAVKEPFLASGRAVDGFFKSKSDPIEKLKTKMGGMLTVFQRAEADKERRRLQAIADEEKRVAAEAEKKAREEARIAREAREAEERRAEEARKAAAALEGKKRTIAEEAERKRLAAAAAAQKVLDDAAAVARDAARVQKEEANTAKADAGAKASDLSRSRSGAGSVASLRTTWEFEVVDAALVPREFLSVSESAIRVAIKAATTPENKNTLKIPGVKIFPKTESIVR
jgi:hypothetical protein